MIFGHCLPWRQTNTQVSAYKGALLKPTLSLEKERILPLCRSLQLCHRVIWIASYRQFLMGGGKYFTFQFCSPFPYEKIKIGFLFKEFPFKMDDKWWFSLLHASAKLVSFTTQEVFELFQESEIGWRAVCFSWQRSTRAEGQNSYLILYMRFIFLNLIATYSHLCYILEWVVFTG